MRPHRRKPTRLLHPWDFPGKSTRVGCHCLLQIRRLNQHNASGSCDSFWVSGNRELLTLFSRNLCICHHLHCALFLPNSGLGTELSILQVSSVTQLSLTLWGPMDCSTPGFPIHHQFPELGQTHAIELVIPFNHLFLCCPLLFLPSVFPSIRVFSNESTGLVIWSRLELCKADLGEGNGTPLQYSCLENPMDGGAW